MIGKYSGMLRVQTIFTRNNLERKKNGLAFKKIVLEIRILDINVDNYFVA
jgi:hypothetical protein